MKYRAFPDHEIARDEELLPGFGAIFFTAKYLVISETNTREENLASFYKQAMNARVPKDGLIPASLDYQGTVFQFQTQGSVHGAPARSAENLLKFPEGNVQLKGIRASGSYPVGNGTMHLWKEVPLLINIGVKRGVVADIGEITITEDYTKRKLFCEIKPTSDPQIRTEILTVRFSKSTVTGFAVETPEVQCSRAETGF